MSFEFIQYEISDKIAWLTFNRPDQLNAMNRKMMDEIITALGMVNTADPSDSNPPGLVSLLGGAGIAVSSHCKHIQQAANYAFWICSSEIQKGLYTEHQGQAGNVTAWEDATANALTNHFFINTRQALNNAYVRPRYPTWPRFQEYLGEIVHDHLLNDRNSLTTMEKLQQAFLESKEKMRK